MISINIINDICAREVIEHIPDWVDYVINQD